MTLELVPVDFDEACRFISMYHRHHRPPVGAKYTVGIEDIDRPGTPTLVGVAIVGRPVARVLADRWTLEVTRSCTDGTRNANSMLYGACWAAVVKLGFRRLVTYTQDGETGASLKAAGWTLLAERPARPGWDTPSRRREKTGTENVLRFFWAKTTANYYPGRPLPRCPQGDVEALQGALWEAS